MNGHKIHTRLWIVVVAVAVIVAVHAAVFGLMLSGYLSLWLVAALAGVLVLKYVWWRLHH